MIVHPMEHSNPTSASSSSTSLLTIKPPIAPDDQQLFLAVQLRRVLRRERKEAVKKLREFNWALSIVGRKFAESERLRYRCSLNWLSGRIEVCLADLRRNRRQHRLLETAMITGQVHQVQDMREWWVSTT